MAGRRAADVVDGAVVAAVLTRCRSRTPIRCVSSSRVPWRASAVDSDVEQCRHDGVSQTGGRAGKAVRRRVAVRAARADAVSRHHGVSGRRTRRRRVRRNGTAARHPRHAEPARIAAVADSNFSFWHSATFSNDGSMVLFSDEWGGGGAPTAARGSERLGRGRDLQDREWKDGIPELLQAPPRRRRSRTASRTMARSIPIPGRTIMVQAWYQGGISIFEWTDPKHPHEIAFFDRGPNDGDARGGRRLLVGRTGTTARSSAPRCSAVSTSSS